MRRVNKVVPLRQTGVRGDTILFCCNEEVMHFTIAYEAENIDDWYKLQREDLVYGENSTNI